jgi:LysM repeat protein
LKFFIVLISFFWLSFFVTENAYAQETYRSHKVAQGETIYSIAKQYGITEAAIYKLNPDARKGISTNSLLILPSVQEEMVATEFKNHRVKRKETLFGIAQQYGVTVDDIKKYNKQLYSDELKKGDKIKIPQFKVPKVIIDEKDTTETISLASQTALHVVQPKETLFGIARKYGISVNELKEMNPNLGQNLTIGTQLKVPSESVLETATIEEDRFGFYEVEAKEGFYRLKVKLGLTEEEIIALNPYAKDGLKEGMILKIPKEISSEVIVEAHRVDLSEHIKNRTKRKVAVLLPFQLKSFETDSLEANEDLLQRNRTLRIALDFYSGVLMASEFIKDKGISVDLIVYDTEGDMATLHDIFNRNDFTTTDAVIGPLLSKNVELAASKLKSDNIPVFSPLTNRNLKLTSNLFQTLPDDNLLALAMIQYLKDNHSGKNMLLIADKTSTNKEAIKEAIPMVRTLSPREAGFLYTTDIQGKLIDNQENWVILESTNPILISNAIGLLNGMPKTYQIRLFTTAKNDSFEYDDVSNMHLSNLQFTYPSVSKSYNLDEKDAFLVSYKNEYGVYPNRFAVRGFDVTYDILLRLASADSIYDSVENDMETEYIENKFHYEKKLFSGYTNQSFYILKYNQELQLEIVK